MQYKNVAPECQLYDPLVTIIIPAFNEAGGIGQVVNEVQLVMASAGFLYEILVIDDGSIDETAAESQSAGACVLQHAYNIGNGAAVKTGIRNARGFILVMMDGDRQHNAEDIPTLIEKISRYDMVVGARTSQSDTQLHRNLANRIYNLFASYICGMQIEDLTSGFRAIKTNVARNFVYLLPNTFSYPTTITLSVVRSGRSLTYVPITSKRRVGKSKINVFKDGSRFLIIILKIATMFSPLRVFTPISLGMFLTGFGYGLFKVLFLDIPYGPTSAMLMTLSILVFLIGLVSDQISQLRFDRSEIWGKSSQD